MNNITNEELLAELRCLDACPGSIEWLDDRDLATAWVECEDPSWMMWWYQRHGPVKRVCVEIAIFCAREVLPIYENKFPNDDRPRKAIEASEAYLLNPCQRTMDAADAAHAAYSAYSAYSAAYAAHAVYSAYSAYSAARVAYAANAARAAYAAANAAVYAANATSANHAEMKRTICNYIREKIIVHTR